MCAPDAAMVNESLTKLICHNPTCVIMSQDELGIAPVFWDDNGKASLAAKAPSSVESTAITVDSAVTAEPLAVPPSRYCAGA
jgi:hypothetical protein